jgi:hypothetical protein
MSVFELLWKFIVTGKTGFRWPPIQQPVLVGGMGIMTPQALSPLDRCVHKPLSVFFCLITVTGVAKVLNLLLKQTLKPGYVGTMTGKAIALGGWFMVDTLLKSITIMAGETVNSCFS